MPSKPEPKAKISIYLPESVLAKLDRHCLNTVGIIKNARSVFVIQAILEKLQREGVYTKEKRGNNAKDNHC